MSDSCPICHRPNTLKRSTCSYCGHVFRGAKNQQQASKEIIPQTEIKRTVARSQQLPRRIKKTYCGKQQLSVTADLFSDVPLPQSLTCPSCSRPVNTTVWQNANAECPNCHEELPPLSFPQNSQGRASVHESVRRNGQWRDASNEKQKSKEALEAEQVAKWMADEFWRSDRFYQKAAVAYIRQHFGEKFLYRNANGNLAISKTVLAAFNEIVGAAKVWNKDYGYWRKWTEVDKSHE